jgi:hypothetical protein
MTNKDHTMVADHWPFKNQSWSWLGLLFVIIMLLAACGCGEVRQPEGTGTPEPTVGEIIRYYGEWFLIVGLIGGAAGVVAWAATFVFAWARPFRELVGDAAVLASVLLLLGASLVWLCDNPWVFYATLVVGSAFAVWWGWPRLRRFWQWVRRSRKGSLA